LPPTITEMRCRPASDPGLNANTISPVCGTVTSAPVSSSVDGSGVGGTVYTGRAVGPGVELESLFRAALIVGDGTGLIVAVGRMSAGFGTVTAVDIEPPSRSSIAAGFP